MNKTPREDIAKVLAEMDAKIKVAKKGVSGEAPKDIPPPQKGKWKVRPLGGLNPHGIKVNWEKKF